jgi:hypothetical protein
MGKLDSLVDWCDKHLGGHRTIGPATIYGFNAMHVAVNISTRWGYLCFHPTMRHHEAWWPWKLYLSPDATPISRRWGFGPGLKYAKRPQRCRRIGA